METGMDIIEQKLGDVVLLDLGGWLDSRGCQALAARAIRVLDDGARVLLLDVSDLGYLTSEGLRTLLFVRQQAIQVQTTLALCGLAGSALELFKISGLRGCFRVFDSQEHALAEVQIGQGIGQIRTASFRPQIPG